jgi:hypothetical protein
VITTTDGLAALAEVPTLMTGAEVAAKLRHRPAQISMWARIGLLRSRVLGGMRYFLPDEVNEFLAQCETMPPPSRRQCVLILEAMQRSGAINGSRILGGFAVTPAPDGEPVKRKRGRPRKHGLSA